MPNNAEAIASIMLHKRGSEKNSRNQQVKLEAKMAALQKEAKLYEKGLKEM